MDLVFVLYSNSKHGLLVLLLAAQCPLSVAVCAAWLLADCLYAAPKQTFVLLLILLAFPRFRRYKRVRVPSWSWML